MHLLSSVQETEEHNVSSHCNIYWKKTILLLRWPTVHTYLFAYPKTAEKGTDMFYWHLASQHSEESKEVPCV